MLHTPRRCAHLLLIATNLLHATLSWIQPIDRHCAIGHSGVVAAASFASSISNAVASSNRSPSTLDQWSARPTAPRCCLRLELLATEHPRPHIHSQLSDLGLRARSLCQSMTTAAFPGPERPHASCDGLRVVRDQGCHRFRDVLGIEHLNRQSILHCRQAGDLYTATAIIRTAA